MLSQRCSRIGFRKSRRSSVGLLLLIPALLVPVPAAAEISHETTLVAEPDHIAVNVFVSGPDSQQLFDNLHDGLTARLEYEIRVLEARDARVSLLGPRFAHDFRVIYRFRWDPYRRRYTAETQDGGFYTFRDKAALRSFVFSLPDFRIPWEAFLIEEVAETRTTGRFQIHTRVLYDPIVFVPGLSILSVFLATSRQQSPWLHHDVEVPR